MRRPAKSVVPSAIMLATTTAALLLVVSTANAQVVRNAAPDTSRPSFSVAPRPLYSMGGLNDNPAYEVIRLGALTLTSKGHLLVSATGDVVREYDLTGKLVRTIGRPGEGPGEFTHVAQIRVTPGDSIQVYDDNRMRILFFAPDGRYLATTASVRKATCCLRDKSFVMAPTRPTTFAFGDKRATIPHEIAQFTGGIAVGKVIMSLLGNDPMIQGVPSPVRGGVAGIPAYSNPFGRTSRLALTWDAIVASDANAFGYEVYSATGTLVRTVRADAPILRVTGGDLAEARSNHNGFREHESRFAIPETWPAHGRIIAERDGRIWVQHFWRIEDENPWWSAFDANGRLLGTIRIPADRAVQAFGFGYVVLSEYIPDDQAVRLHVHRVDRNIGG